MGKKYILNVSGNVAHTYLWYALKFSILYDSQYQKWYHSHFINPVIYAYRDRNIYKIDYCEYFDEMNVFSDVLEIDLYTNDNCIKTDIGDYFKDCIENNIYIEIEIDFFYVRGYNEYHFTHPVLIYGYEDDTYFALGFSYNDIFSFFSLSEGELIQAYQSAVDINYSTGDMIDKYAYHLLKRKSNINNFGKDNFMEQLKLYHAGSYKVNTSKKFPDGMNEKGEIITGRMAIIGMLNFIISNSVLNVGYRAFHFLAEHKSKLFEDIIFWRKDLNVCNDLIESFRDISEQYEALRLRILRDKVKNQRRGEDIFSHKEYLCNCLGYIEQLVGKERELLEKILLNN